MRVDALDFPFQLLELGVARAPLDQLARLATDEHADPLLEELESHAPAQPTILLLLRGHVRFARFQVSEPRPDSRGQLGIVRIGVFRARRLDDLERAVNVLAIELEADRLDDGVDVTRIHVRLS